MTLHSPSEKPQDPMPRGYKHIRQAQKNWTFKFLLDRRTYNSFVHCKETDVVTMGITNMQNTYKQIAKSIL